MLKEIYNKLKDDKHYYGDYGKQFLSNSDIATLLKNPLMLHKDKKQSPAFLVGGYLHTAILEPKKLKSFKVVDSTTRNTKKYKEISNGELCLLKHEVDKIEKMIDTINKNQVCRDLIDPLVGKDITQLKSVEYEQPKVGKIFDNMWKGKADIINHEEKLIIDIKTTSDIDRFKWSAHKYNYDSQAYIYSKLFQYEMVFLVIDKDSLQIGLFDCSPEFYASGEDKVRRASEAYDLFYKTDNFDPNQFLINKTL
jgi:hypothetical protein